jgi:hypothetical protein
VAPAEVDVGPGDRVERHVRRFDEVVARVERAVGGALAQELDERVEVVGRLSGGGVLVKRLVGREHQREVAVEQLAERDEPALEPVAARPTGRQDREQRLAEVGRELPDERGDKHVARQALPPERRPRPARGFGHSLERQPVPAPLAQHGDRRAVQLGVEDGAAARMHRP